MPKFVEKKPAVDGVQLRLDQLSESIETLADRPQAQTETFPTHAGNVEYSGGSADRGLMLALWDHEKQLSEQTSAVDNLESIVDVLAEKIGLLVEVIDPDYDSKRGLTSAVNQLTKAIWTLNNTMGGDDAEG